MSKTKEKKVITKDKWVWMPHPAHLIISHECRFVLATRIGKYIVSTVGEWFPDSAVREVFAEVRGIKLEGKGDARAADYMKKLGYKEIGINNLYETMVFECERDKKNPCCGWKIRASDQVDGENYNDPVEARKGHMTLCNKWSKR